MWEIASVRIIADLVQVTSPVHRDKTNKLTRPRLQSIINSFLAALSHTSLAAALYFEHFQFKKKKKGDKIFNRKTVL